MTLKNSLYTLLGSETHDGHLCYNLRLHPDSFIYQAHFPGEPVTPGVCIVQMAKELLEDHLQQPLHLTTVKNVKFLSVITPLETPELSYVLDKIQSITGENGKSADGSQKNTIRAQFTVKSSDKEFAKLSLGFTNK
jgi:3-hydroxyacyl-[acyl-carrier-protein] dehydratase